MKPKFLILVLIAFIPLSGCNHSARISQVRLNDPNVGISADVVVNRDGTFNDEVKNGNDVAILQGNVRSVGDGEYEVTVNYERKTYTSATTFKSDKLKCKLTTVSGTVVPIGKQPAGNADGDNALEQLTIQLAHENDH